MIRSGIIGKTHLITAAGRLCLPGLVLTLVGCVWGWAFLRFDALTVVLSHFTADLFIFNWPQLASGQTAQVAVAVATICVPLLPALLWPLQRRTRAG